MFEPDEKHNKITEEHFSLGFKSRLALFLRVDSD